MFLGYFFCKVSSSFLCTSGLLSQCQVLTIRKRGEREREREREIERERERKRKRERKKEILKKYIHVSLYIYKIFKALKRFLLFFSFPCCCVGAKLLRWEKRKPGLFRKGSIDSKAIAAQHTYQLHAFPLLKTRFGDPQDLGMLENSENVGVSLLKSIG